MSLLIALLLTFAGAWMVGRAVMIERDADINEMGFALVMGGVGISCVSIGLLWALWLVFTRLTIVSIP